MNTNIIIGRDRQLFARDIANNSFEIDVAIKGSRVLIYGGAGSIGKEVAAQIFSRAPAAIHILDISENNLVELVRHIRSTQGYIAGEAQFLPLDMGSIEAAAFIDSQKPYDYVLNLAAMKHVRSEKDPYSLMRMIKTNVIDTLATSERARQTGTKKYFAVSTDKAKNPANLMGATKRIMEDVLFRSDNGMVISTARFANVAFSDGSLLHGFRQRVLLRQPISAPKDIRRYFVTGEESGLLCLCSILLGGHREIFFPNLDSEADLLTFSEIAGRFLTSQGYEPFEVSSEDEARDRCAELIESGKWPCFFFESDTAGEKPFEEFYSGDDIVDWNRFQDIGVISQRALNAAEKARVEAFLVTIESLRAKGRWAKADLTAAIYEACPELSHAVSDRSLDEKM